ncbi:hypothetical protein K440DRAFT_642596 [Wilcoxina mikolae CBS 423.85]|nr:hypothetical protein K440DRAFT_642596 [Wilcoxina mikolae CBS 423.85]
MGLKLYRGLVKPVAYYPFKEDQRRTRTLSLSAPPPNCQIPSVWPVLTSFTPPTEEEKLSDFETPTASESFSSEDSSPKVPDIADTTPEDVTEVVDDITEVVDDITEVFDDITEVVDDVIDIVDEDDKDTSSDSVNKSSETAVTSTPVRTKVFRKRKRAGQPPTSNSTEDKPIDRYDAVVTSFDYM